MNLYSISIICKKIRINLTFFSYKLLNVYKYSQLDTANRVLYNNKKFIIWYNILYLQFIILHHLGG